MTPLVRDRPLDFSEFTFGKDEPPKIESGRRVGLRTLFRSIEAKTMRAPLNLRVLRDFDRHQFSKMRIGGLLVGSPEDVEESKSPTEWNDNVFETEQDETERSNQQDSFAAFLSNRLRNEEQLAEADRVQDNENAVGAQDNTDHEDSAGRE